MRVLVDTEPPQLEVNCNRGSAGEVYCLWKTIDPHLKAETLQLSYQGIDGGSQWQPVAVAPSTPAADGVWNGRTTFVPTGVKWPLFVRVEVSDVAGNRATAQVQVQTAPGVGPQSLSVTNSLGGGTPFAPPTNSPNTAPSSGWQPGSTATPGAVTPLPPSDFGASSSVPASPNPSNWPPAMASSFPGRITPPPRSEAVPKMPVAGHGPAASSLGENLPTTAGREPIPSPATADLGPRYRNASDSRLGLPGAFGSVDVETLPTPGTPAEPIRRTLEPEPQSSPPAPDLGPSFASPDGGRLPEFTGPQEVQRPALGDSPALGSSPTPDDADDEATPPGVNPRMVNSRRFELEYDVESIGSARVAKVELWTTRDAGRTWTLSGTDADAASPYIVSVDEEGVYGFRMVIETTTGVRSPAPKPGDLPEVWVGVDVTKPTARIVSVQQRGDDSGAILDIRWEADDRLLTGRPVTLSFAENADGPWTTIAAGLPNTHSYDWRYDVRTPEQIYVKIDVRDVAGNTTTHVTPDPVTLERVRPQGRIRGVRPLGESARLRAPSQILPR
jgi:hypothetical protein